MEQNDKGLFAAFTQETLNHFPLITFMKDTPSVDTESYDSRYGYINEAAQDFANLPANFDFNGRLDDQLSTPGRNLPLTIRHMTEKHRPALKARRS